MTGPEHYREAERLLTRNRTEDYDGTEYVVSVPSDRDLVEAQVHATLALAAATAELDVYEGPTGHDGTGRTSRQVAAWAEVISNG